MARAIQCPGLVMPKVLSCRKSCHARSLVMPKVWSCRRSRHAQSLVILSNAKDLRGEASGLPGRPEQPCSRMRVALCRAGIRALSPGRSFGLRPQDDKDEWEEPSWGRPLAALRVTAEGAVNPWSKPSSAQVLSCRRSRRAEGFACRRPWRTEGLGMPKVLSS